MDKSIFIKCGIISDEMSKKIDKEHMSIENKSQEIINKIQEDYELCKSAYQSFLDDENKEINKIYEIVSSKQFKNICNNEIYYKKIQKRYTNEMEAPLQILHSKKRLQKFIEFLENIEEEYYKEQYKLVNEIKSSVGEVIWNEFGIYFKNPEFYNKLSNLNFINSITNDEL